jgi:beta-glucanase (GH16 family)
MKYNNSILIKSIFFSALLFTFWSCGETNDIEVRDYQLVWEDNFDGSAGESPDATKWVYDLGRGPNGDGWGNQELQIYTDKPENVSLDGEGNLAITVLSTGTFTSARIKTEGQFDQAFGRIEARMKLPYGPGIHPAFWMLGADFSQIGWPECGEIDIMELKGQEPNIIHGSLHGPGYSAGNSVSKTYGLANARFDTDFYVFAIQWGPDFIEWYVDDKIYQRVTPDDVPGEWVFDHPFFMLLNVAVGGTFVGFPSEGTIYPQTMLVDYVRVYREVNP